MIPDLKESRPVIREWEVSFTTLFVTFLLMTFIHNFFTDTARV